jgi:predicted DNA-binding transcriptional regulator AlpA
MNQGADAARRFSTMALLNLDGALAAAQVPRRGRPGRSDREDPAIVAFWGGTATVASRARHFNPDDPGQPKCLNFGTFPFGRQYLFGAIRCYSEHKRQVKSDSCATRMSCTPLRFWHLWLRLHAKPIQTSTRHPVLREPKMYNERAAAKFLGLSPRTLQKYRCEGNNGPRYFKLGRAVRYSKQELNDWLAARLAGNTREAETLAKNRKNGGKRIR